jgi:hypothetical protein
MSTLIKFKFPVGNIFVDFLTVRDLSLIPSALVLSFPYQSIMTYLITITHSSRPSRSLLLLLLAHSLARFPSSFAHDLQPSRMPLHEIAWHSMSAISLPRFPPSLPSFPPRSLPSLLHPISFKTLKQHTFSDIWSEIASCPTNRDNRDQRAKFSQKVLNFSPHERTELRRFIYRIY